MSEFRRRLMMANSGAKPITPYISDGLVFWLDGIDKGRVQGAWRDLVGHYLFKIVNGVTAIEDGFVFANPHEMMRNANAGIDIPYEEGTIEVVCSYSSGTAFIWQPGVNYSMCFCFYGNRIGFAHQYGSQNLYSIPTDKRDASTICTYSVTALDGYINMETMPVNGKTYFGINTRATIGSRGNRDMYYGTIKSIRIYSRQLTYAERLANAQVDNERFNLGLNI